MVDPKVKSKLKEEGLQYCSDQKPGFFRQRVGERYEYYDLDGNRLKDKKHLERIKRLIIPPAWKDVWVCPEDNGHLQATGKDEKGRKQYIYHPDWVKISQENKFSKMVDFGLSLPKIRSRIRYDLSSTEMDKRKVLATLIWLLEHTFIRVGNEEYSKENSSFGLTTLRNKHVKVIGDEIIFQFRGKSGVNHLLRIKNPIIAKTIKRCVELPGYELFQFIDEDGQRHVIDSSDVNEFLKLVTKEDFSAKDFRTWGGTNIGANHFYKLGEAEDKTHLKKNTVETVKKVASHLQNTVAVCRNYYIHPTVFKTYEQHLLVPHFNSHRNSQKPGLSWDEYALIRLLQKYPIANLSYG